MALTKEQRDEMLLALKADEQKVVTEFTETYKVMLAELKAILDKAKPPEGGLVSDAYIQMSSLYNNVSAYLGSASQLEQKHGEQTQPTV